MHLQEAWFPPGRHGPSGDVKSFCLETRIRFGVMKCNERILYIMYKPTEASFTSILSQSCQIAWKGLCKILGHVWKFVHKFCQCPPFGDVCFNPDPCALQLWLLTGVVDHGGRGHEGWNNLFSKQLKHWQVRDRERYRKKGSKNNLCVCSFSSDVFSWRVFPRFLFFYLEYTPFPDMRWSHKWIFQTWIKLYVSFTLATGQVKCGANSGDFRFQKKWFHKLSGLRLGHKWDGWERKPIEISIRVLLITTSLLVLWWNPLC